MKFLARVKKMLCVVFQIHRNILSSQCYIRCADDSSSFSMIQVKCLSSELELLLLSKEKIVKKITMISPKDFFIPSSLSSDSESYVISGSTVSCQAILTANGQSVVECSFRLQISGIDKLDQPESELKVDVKDFFRKRFKTAGHWNLFCACCGASLSSEPVFIESVREYSESELSEGWFCHGNGPQQPLHPPSNVLYLDDTSFYLYPRPNFKSEVTAALVNKSCITDSQRNYCINALNTNSHSDSGINSSSKSVAHCDCNNIDQSISKTPNSISLSVSSSVTSDINSCLKDTDSLPERPMHHTHHDCKVSTVNCQSCRSILTSEKSPDPFIRFYMDKIVFKNATFDDDHLEYAHNIALLSFWSLVRKSQTSQLPSKLFLQSKVHDEDFCLLLWVPSTPVAQFLLRDCIEAIPTEIHLRTEPMYKVLYFVGTSLSENVRSWRHDFGVDFYRVSDTMVKTLAEILDASSGHLPATSTAGGFSCGFLKAPSQLQL